MNILILDNYDSFTYNLAHYVERVADTVFADVRLCNKINLDEVEQYDKIILSPGSGLPGAKGIMLDVIKIFCKTKPILGVCLGQQAIGTVFGGSLKNLDEVFHGVATPIHILKEDSIFKNIPRRINVGRYHSWVIDKKNLPDELEITAEDEFGNIMAIRHKRYDLSGVQFHPESILSEYGFEIIKNWVNKN